MLKPVKMQLREEKLDIHKRKVKISDVNIYKRTVHNMCEELIIEKKNFDNSPEKIEIIKLPINEGKFSIYHKQFHGNEHIVENLKREKERIKSKENEK